MVVNLKTHVGRTEQISRHYLALRRMFWRHFSAEEPWVLEWIRIPSDTWTYHVDGWIRFEYATCGRGYFWIRKEKVADSKTSGYVWTGPEVTEITWQLHLHVGCQSHVTFSAKAYGQNLSFGAGCLVADCVQNLPEKVKPCSVPLVKITGLCG